MKEALHDTSSDIKMENPEIEESASQEAVPTKNVTSENTDDKTDYEAIVKEDIEALRDIFPELQGIKDITDLENPIRYATLRDLGLSAEEAYLATTPRRKARDNRSHLLSGVPRSASSHSSVMSESELEAARQIFTGLSDMEIKKLYKKVTK